MLHTRIVRSDQLHQAIKWKNGFDTVIDRQDCQQYNGNFKKGAGCEKSVLLVCFLEIEIDHHPKVVIDTGSTRKYPDNNKGNQSCLNGSCEDRKSTRLNSSHVAISYADFCLKKKKNRDR